MPTDNAWLESLKPLAERLRPHAAAVADELLSVVRQLNSPIAVITFGGRFNAGKSSMMNAALGQRILPMGDFAETGANCHLVHGIFNAASLVWKNRPREQIGCNADAIKNAITLRGGPERLATLTQLHYLEIQLRNFAGGTLARWIDPPGLFDQDEMTPFARAALQDSDVVVWILRSQQFLGQQEADGIAEHIDARGPASVVFVENAFLNADQADPWAYHQREIAPVNRGKLRVFARDIGLANHETPTLLSVSAERMLAGAQGFGADELRRVLDTLRNPAQPRIRLARLQRAARVLDQACLLLTPAVDAGRNQATLQGQAEQQRLQTQQRAQSKMAEVLATQPQAFWTAWESAVARCATETAQGVVANALKRDGTYQTQLQTKLQQHMRDLCEQLVRQLNNEAQRWGANTLPPSAQQTLGQLLLVPSAAIAVPDTAVGGNVLAGAIAGGAVGTVVPIVGTLFGAIIGAVTAGAASTSAAHEKDATATRVNIHAAAQAISAQVAAKKGAVQQLLAQHYVIPAPLQVGPSVASQRYQALQTLLADVQRAAAHATQMAQAVAQTIEKI